MVRKPVQSTIIIPDYDPYNPQPYPGDIKPGYYSKSEIKRLVRKYKHNPAALQFLRDMLEI